MGRISLRPKVGLDDATAEYVYRASVGARVGWSFWLFAPQVFAHMGWGWLSGNTDVSVVSNRGLTYEAGGALDFDALPFVRLGVYTSFNRLVHSRKDDELTNTDWLTYGLQGTILW